MTDLLRCRAGRKCGDGENTTDPDTGEHVRLGAVVFTPHALCGICTNRLGYGLGSLPLDVIELSKLLVPATAPRLRDPDLPPQPHMRKAGPRLPLQENPFALQQLIDQETGFWSASVAAAADVEWSVEAAGQLRQFDRVAQACQLLKYRITQFVELPVQRHPARSLKVGRAEGHDPDTITRGPDEYWVDRDGVTGALLLMDLHRRTLRLAGRHPADRLGTPCPKCETQSLFRERHNNQVICRRCDRPMSDADYEQLLALSLAAFGIEAA